MSGGVFRFGAHRETADGLEVAVTVPAACPWFAGHFPDQPILPGVAHLHLACLLAGLPGVEPAALAAVEAWRWSEPVAPGEELVATLAAAGDGRSRLALRRGEGGHGGGKPGKVSGGTLISAKAGDRAGGAEPRDRAGSPAAVGSPAVAAGSPAGHGAAASAEPAPDPPAAFPSIVPPGGGLAALLPHQPPARLAEALLEAGPQRLVCRGRVGAAHPAVSSLGAPSFLAVELAAQACAGWSVVDGEGGAGAAAPRGGYLVRLRDVRFARPWLAPAAPLTASVEREARTGPLTLCRFRVVDAAGAELAAGSLGVFQPPAD